MSESKWINFVNKCISKLKFLRANVVIGRESNINNNTII